ncbi:hypothetical protein L3X38_029232 [Prunus dulcis]|uniref:Uncharacterized protein n=1 Tax=Prunus dulcis TaxID=3755 RepID=A0AAD4VR75_PRUDU|nr:hypothetical protein L3X38_029232 [Prunus dulcis]
MSTAAPNLGKRPPWQPIPAPASNNGPGQMVVPPSWASPRANPAWAVALGLLTKLHHRHHHHHHHIITSSSSHHHHHHHHHHHALFIHRPSSMQSQSADGDLCPLWHDMIGPARHGPLTDGSRRRIETSKEKERFMRSDQLLERGIVRFSTGINLADSLEFGNHPCLCLLEGSGSDY